MTQDNKSSTQNLDKSAWATIIAISMLFASAVIVTLFAPNYIDPTWVEPTSPYQVQVYEVADPNVYISGLLSGSSELQSVYHLKKGFTLMGFQESETVRIIAPPELEKYITRHQSSTLKLTSHLLLLRKPKDRPDFKALTKAKKLRSELQEKWVKNHPDWKEKKLRKPAYEILELFAPPEPEAFAIAPIEGIIENWVDTRYEIVDQDFPRQPYHADPGVIYVNNPKEYRVKFYRFGDQEEWKYDPNGQQIANLEELRSHPLGFRSREELISVGEHIYAIEGCWYCHTDQTRTLVQDVVLNGSDSYPAPPSSANEYIYQRITFPGTRRIGPDVSRVGIKRPSRDWHKSHFWAPKLASKGSIMPAFQHFFDYDPRGTSKSDVGIPNYKFEAVFQYLMTKGTRITPPTQAWWLGRDPIQTKEIIEGRKRLR